MDQFNNLTSLLRIDETFPNKLDVNQTKQRNEEKCNVVQMMEDSGLSPFGARLRDGTAEEGCAPLFDSASCFPATPPGSVRVIPCMDYYSGVAYDTSGRIHRILYREKDVIKLIY